MNANPTLIVYCGPMFSAKTSRLLLDLERFKYQHKRSFVFKPSIDDRYGTDEIVSHSGWRHEATMIKDGADLVRVLSEATETPDVVAVDEAFMLSGIADVLIWLYRSGITIVVSSLDMSSAGKPFKEIERLLPWATRIEKCTAVCTECGRDAYYTHRKHAVVDEIWVGGAELYEPRCFRHHVSIDSRPDIAK